MAEFKMKEMIFNVHTSPDGMNMIYDCKGKLVRCGECKYFDRIEPNHPCGYCHAAKHGYHTSRWEISIYRKCKDDFYCADGERKDGAE